MLMGFGGLLDMISLEIKAQTQIWGTSKNKAENLWMASWLQNGVRV